MGYEGYLTVGGNEVVNTSRAHAAAAALGIGLGCDRCPDFSRELGQRYRAPDDPDYPAPWYDPAYPESAGFGGIIGLETEGLSGSPMSNVPTPLLRGGSLPSPPRMEQREIAWTVQLVAVDECSLSYGMSWLAAALRGSPCNSGCEGQTACVLACCPTSLDPRWVPRQIRYLYSVEQLEGPTETERMFLPARGSAACRGRAGLFGGGGRPVTAEVEFTLVAGRPWYYREPVTVASQVTPRQVVNTSWTWNLPADCPEPADCATDPNCDRPPMPPIPPAPPDPCVPGGGYVADLAMVRIPPGLVGSWDEFVPLIYVDTGYREIRRLQVRFFANPGGGSCEYEDLDQCTACYGFGIGYVPANASLTIDGRTEQAYVDCGTGATAGRQQTEPLIYGPGGSALDWPVFRCGSGLCVWVAAEVDETPGCLGPGWSVTIQLVPRNEAI